MTAGFVMVSLTAPVRMVVLLIYVGPGETMSEKVGVLNIGMEGVVLGEAFFSFAGTPYSGSLVADLLCGMAGGAMVSTAHGPLSIKLTQDQSVNGIVVNIFMAGVASSLYKLMLSGWSYQQIEPFVKSKMSPLGDISLIRNALFNQDILTYGIHALVILVTLFCSRMSKGMAFAVIGENLRAADSTGIPVYQYQWAAVLLNEMLGGLGSAYLILVQMGNFSESMTSGRGYIALTAVVLSRHVPFGMMSAAFIFGAVDILQIRPQVIGVPLPTQALVILLYIITPVALLSSIGKNSAPEALGEPHIRGAKQISGIMIDSPPGLR